MPGDTHSTRRARRSRFDAIVIGAGHNGLVAAALLAQAGRSVLVLERSPRIGGACASMSFPGVEARLSRYAYLVSLVPRAVLKKLGLQLAVRVRGTDSYTPAGNGGLLVARADAATRHSMHALTGDDRAFAAWLAFHGRLEQVARATFPTLTEPLGSREELRRRIADNGAWEALFEEPLATVLERTFTSDLVRGVVATDSAIGTFAAADDATLSQNRCFLYHVIGNGTGRWDVPVGGMGAVAEKLAAAAFGAGAEIRVNRAVAELATDGRLAEVSCETGERFQAAQVLAGVAPVVLARLLGERPPEPAPEGSQLKLNMLLSRLPRLCDDAVGPTDAFGGTFHVNEGYEQLQAAYAAAARNEIPSVPPCELYCHSLSDPTILSPKLARTGAHTLTAFGLHMPARLFAQDPERRKREAVEATLRSVNSVLAEPLEDCLYRGPEGAPCLEALTPPELEAELAMPGGHIFHRDLRWPYAESQEELGTWGVETDHANVWICGAGARRGGGVSGIPGHNAAMAVLGADHPTRAVESRRPRPTGNAFG